MKWTRLTCRNFRDNQARLQWFALAYDRGNFLRQLALTKSVKNGTCDFDIGAQAAGSLDAVAVAIPANAASVTLSYCSAYDGERGRAPDGFDAAWVAANGDVVDDVGFTTTLLAEWEPRLVDLSAYAGRTVTLAWHFDSIDAINNAMLGWQVDQIELSAVIDNDCNGNTIPDDCDIADLTSTDGPEKVSGPGQKRCQSRMALPLVWQGLTAIFPPVVRRGLHHAVG